MAAASLLWTQPDGVPGAHGSVHPTQQLGQGSSVRDLVQGEQQAGRGSASSRKRQWTEEGCEIMWGPRNHEC